MNNCLLFPSSLATCYSSYIFCSLRCDFHEEKETKFCSLGVCNIYTFVAAECLCPKFGVSLTSAHLPKLSVGGTVTTFKMKTPSDEVARDLDNEDYPDSDGNCVYVCVVSLAFSLLGHSYGGIPCLYVCKHFSGKCNDSIFLMFGTSHMA